MFLQPLKFDRIVGKESSKTKRKQTDDENSLLSDGGGKRRRRFLQSLSENIPWARYDQENDSTSSVTSLKSRIKRTTLEGSGMGGMKLPIGMTRRALSYDDNLEAPMSTPPHDISINNLWRRPIIPERKFSQLAEEDESGAVKQSSVQNSAPPKAPAVVKTKASSIIMNSLITKQTQESMYKFEQSAGLTDTSYTPHKGLTAEETRHHHRMPESLQKLQIQNMEVKEERNSSAQSTPSNTPHSSPKQQRRGWFGSTSSEVSMSSSGSSVDMGGGETAAGGAVERWGVFGPRPLIQNSASDLGSDSTPAGFAVQVYRGAQKPTPMEVMKSQATRLVDNPQKESPPKMEIPTVEGRRHGARPHKLKHRDMNILTPSGF
ncbi:putative monooxygenase p33MONOX isoform X2 [Melanotaenia boesemani]|uniref:putative monooxygenase p33MONOX isoform X2 n=1 Tax=Melanotaenia boesemani TaxID=1250792 RepID=UPI001C059093|nr:putative monooxygenase p33MONOX isoform X2 [Melanotaenia boesemani]